MILPANTPAKMPTPPMVLAALLEPPIPDLTVNLLRETGAVEALIRHLDGRLAGGLAHVVGPIFRAAHTHHSLYIEDRPSTLVELARASSTAPTKGTRDRVADLRASMEVLSWLHEGDGRSWATAAPTDWELLRELHRRCYENLPLTARTVRTGDTGRELDLGPGEWREEHLMVGTHLAPEPADLPALLERWAIRFAPSSYATSAERLLAMIASHHRLLFIHPFRDGNGRAARFALDAYLISLGLDAKGAWTPARGFARARTSYYEALQAADAERRHANDGRGGRSAEGLRAWCEFVLRVFREQVEFVSKMLEPVGLRERVRRAVGESLDQTTTKRAKVGAARLVLAAWDHGPLSRSELTTESAVPERSARRLLVRLEELGWVRSVAGADARKALVVGAMPIERASMVFPDLFLPGAEREDES